MNRPPNDLKPLPKPVRLEVSRSGREEKREKPKREAPTHTPPAEKGLRHFEQAQRLHGQRRPAPKKIKKPRRPTRYTKEIGIVCLVLICVGLVVFSIILLRSDNALAVYLNGTRVGYLPLNRETREWDAEHVRSQAISHRSATVSADIRVNEQVRLVPVRTNRRNLANGTITEAITQISAGFTYQIVASAIYIDGERIAVLRALSLAEYVEQFFIGAYATPQYTIQSEIVGWEVRTLFVDSDFDFNSTHYARDRLDRRVEAIIPYIVRDNDTKSGIASRHNIVLNRLLEDNNLAFDAIIRPGDVLNIHTTRPFVTVRTVDEETRTVIIPKETLTNYTDQLAVGIINVENEGRDGERIIVVHATYENGQLVFEEIISNIITVQAETRVVNVGTSATVAPAWR